MNRKQIKEEARFSLKGQWFMFFVFLLIFSLVSDTIFLLAPLGLYATFLIASDVLEGRELDINRVGVIFRDLNHALKVIAVNLLVGLIVLGGTLLFIVPGLIWAYMYCQATFIMIENPEMNITDALRASKKMMKGYKFDRFVFGLSFFWHYVLLFLTFGIYGIYFGPYVNVASINYYRHLKGADKMVTHNDTFREGAGI